MDPLGGQISFAAVVVWGLNFLKESPSAPWISQHTKVLNRVLGVIAATVSAVGVKLLTCPDCHWSPFTGGEVHLYIPSVFAMLQAAEFWVRSMAFQEMIHRLFQRTEVEETRQIVQHVAGQAEVPFPPPARSGQ